MRYMYKCDKVFKVHIYSLSCKILPIASVMVTDRFLHRECNLWGQYIIQVHPPRNLPSGTWVHIFRVLVVRSLPIASVSSVYQGIDLQYKKHEYGQTLVEYAITWTYIFRLSILLNLGVATVHFVQLLGRWLGLNLSTWWASPHH